MMTEACAIGVVEDNSADVFFLRRALRKVAPSCDVTVFAYAAEALNHVRAPDAPRLRLIFLDINLPRMSGFEFADAFSELDDALRSNTRLVMVSHSIDPDDRARAELHPAIYAFLPKPISVDLIRPLF